MNAEVCRKEKEAAQTYDQLLFVTVGLFTFGLFLYLFYKEYLAPWINKYLGKQRTIKTIQKAIHKAEQTEKTIESRRQVLLQKAANYSPKFEAELTEDDRDYQEALLEIINDKDVAVAIQKITNEVIVKKSELEQQQAANNESIEISHKKGNKFRQSKKVRQPQPSSLPKEILHDEILTWDHSAFPAYNLTKRISTNEMLPIYFLEKGKALILVNPLLLAFLFDNFKDDFNALITLCVNGKLFNGKSGWIMSDKPFDGAHVIANENNGKQNLSIHNKQGSDLKNPKHKKTNHKNKTAEHHEGKAADKPGESYIKGKNPTIDRRFYGVWVDQNAGFTLFEVRGHNTHKDKKIEYFRSMKTSSAMRRA